MQISTFSNTHSWLLSQFPHISRICNYINFKFYYNLHDQDSKMKFPLDYICEIWDLYLEINSKAKLNFGRQIRIAQLEGLNSYELHLFRQTILYICYLYMKQHYIDFNKNNDLYEQETTFQRNIKRFRQLIKIKQYYE